MNKALRIGLCCLFFGIASIAGGCAEKVDPNLSIKYEVGGAVPKKNTVVPRDEGKNIIEFYGPIDNTGAVGSVVSKYNQTNREDYINYHELKNSKNDIYEQYLLSLNAGETVYDIIMYDISWNTDFAARGLITELDTYIGEYGLDLSAYMQNAIETSRYNGKMYSMPVNIGISMLYFRRDLVHTAPTTWDELIDFSVSAKERNIIKNSFVFNGIISYEATYYFMEMLNSYGVKLFDDTGFPISDRPRLSLVLEKYRQIYCSDFVPTTINFSNETNACELFSKGDSLMMLGMPSVWNYANGKKSNIVGKFSMAPLPAGSANAKINQFLTGSSIAINSTSENKTSSWNFINYMVGYIAQRILAVTGGYSPSLSEIYDNNDAKSANAHFSSSVFRKALSGAVLQPTSPNYFNCMMVLQKQLEKYITGEQNVEITMDLIDSGLRSAVSLPVQ